MSGYLPEATAARPRPVPDASVQALAGDYEELARRWAFALLAAHPLAELTAVPLEEIVRHAPALCAAAVRSLSSEEELASFAAGGADVQRPDSAPGLNALRSLARDWDAGEAVEHVEALRRVLWEALLHGLASPSPREVADLADRLACVCSVLLGAAIAERVPVPSEEGTRRAARARPEQVLYRSDALPGRTGAVLIDERDEQERSRRPPVERRVMPGGGREAEPTATVPGALPWDIPLHGPGRAERSAPAARDEDAVLRVSRGPLASD
jgi:hypothetical protein